MQTVLTNQKVITRKKKFNLVLGLKRTVQAVSEYFGIESQSDHVWFYGFYGFCAVIVSLVALLNITM